MGLLTRALVAGVALCLLSAATAACSRQEVGTVREETPMQRKTIEQVLQEHADSLMSHSGVVAVGQGECSGKPCIRVFVVKKTPELLKELPAEIEGYVVTVDESGEIRPLGNN